MPNLIDQLGAEYVDQFYRGAYFMLGDKILQYGRHDPDGSGKILCKGFNADAASPRFATLTIPQDRIESMDTFGWPKLGYRELKEGDDKFVYFISLNRSAMRGMRDELLQFSPAPPVGLLPGRDDARRWCSAAMYAQAIFRPKFTDFDEGVWHLREGVYTSFALSPDLAVCLSTSKSVTRSIDVLFRETIIGEVLDDNTVVVPPKIIKRSSNAALFKGKAVLK